MRRAVRLAAAVAVLAVVFTPALPSQATKRDPLVIQAGKTVTQTFPALVGSVPQSEEQVRPNPSDCSTYTWCDTVPLDITPPSGLKDDDDFFVEIKVGWDNPSGQNDLDNFAYDDQQTKGGAGYTQKASGASADNPETLRLFRPTLGRYNLVVLNFVGPNTGYTVTAKLLESPYQAPFEALAPGKKGATTTTTSTTRPVEATAPPETTPGDTAPPTLAPAPVSTDNDFDFGTSDFEDQLAAPPRPEGGFEGESAAPANQVKKVGGGVVAIWFVVAPLILLGAAGFFIVRRRGGVAGF